MNTNPLENQSSKQEKLDIRVEIATEKDWEACRDLRMNAIDSSDAEMLGFTSGEEKSEKKKLQEKIKTEADWKKELSSLDIFWVLSWEGSQVVGQGLAKKREEQKDWWMGSGYIKNEEDFRGKGIGKKMFAVRLNEIKKRGGEKVRMGVKAANHTSIHIAELFGFKKVVEDSDDIGFLMELKNVNDLAVIKKIDEVLNAR